MNTRSAQRVRIALAACLALLLFAREVRADASDPARSASARALFEVGVSYADSEAWKQAADAFRRALALRDSPVIRFNLASALSELGQVVEASELLHQVQVDVRADAALRAQAEDKLAEVKPRIARLTVHGPIESDGWLVTLDELELSTAELGLPRTVDPGLHQVRAQRAGELVDERSVTLGPGESAELTLRAPAPEPAPVAAAPLVITPAQTAEAAQSQPEPAHSLPGRDEPRRDAPSRKRLWWGVAVGAAGAIAFVTLVALLVPQRTKQAGSQGDFDPPAVAVRVPQ